MLLLVNLGVFAAFIAVLIGAQKYRDRHRYRGARTQDTDGHLPVDGAPFEHRANPSLLGSKQEVLGMGFPGGGTEAKGPNQ